MAKKTKQQELEDLVLGNDTNDQDVLRQRVSDWLTDHNFDTDGIEDEDPVGLLADAISGLSPAEITACIKRAKA